MLYARHVMPVVLECLGNRTEHPHSFVPKIEWACGECGVEANWSGVKLTCIRLHQPDMPYQVTCTAQRCYIERW